MWKLSKKYLEKAIKIFEEVGDNDNLALLHCNKGRYLRMYAFYTCTDGNHILTPLIKETYEKVRSLLLTRIITSCILYVGIKVNYE